MCIENSFVTKKIVNRIVMGLHNRGCTYHELFSILMSTIRNNMATEYIGHKYN